MCCGDYCNNENGSNFDILEIEEISESDIKGLLCLIYTPSFQSSSTLKSISRFRQSGLLKKLNLDPESI